MEENQYLIKKERNIKFMKKDISHLGFAMVALVLVSQLSAIGIFLLTTKINPDLLGNSIVSIIIGTLPIYLVGFPAMYLIAKNIKKTTVIEKRKMKFTTLLKFLIFSFGIMYISNFISIIINLLISKLIGKPISSNLEDIVISTDIYIKIIFIVIIGPIMEEIIFRKVLLSRLLNYGEFVAIFLSAFMFGAFHGNLVQFLYAFSLGLIFGYVTVKTGMIKYSIIMHIVVNFIGSVGIVELVATKNPILIIIVGMAIIAALVFAIVFLVLNIGRVKFKDNTNTTLKQKFYMMFGNAGVITFIVITIAIIVLGVY